MSNRIVGQQNLSLLSGAHSHENNETKRPIGPRRNNATHPGVISAPFARRVIPTAPIPFITKKTKLSTKFGPVRILEIEPNLLVLTGTTIAKGGYGKIRVGIDIRTERVFAIKEFRRFSSNDDRGSGFSHFETWQEVDALDRFSKELKPIGMYQHAKKEKAGFFMPCMTGSIQELDFSRFPCDQRRGYRKVVAQNMASQVSLELIRIHENGFIHGDIKLQNILFNKQGIIALGDWGISGSFINAPNSDEVILGTIQPPRHKNITMYGPALDIFALGYSLWHIYVPDHKLYGVGRNPESSVSYDDFLLWQDWTRDRRKKIRSPSANLENMMTWWERFEHIDKPVADFVLNHMLNFPSKNTTGKTIHDFFSGRCKSSTNRLELVSALSINYKQLPIPLEITRISNSLHLLLNTDSTKNSAIQQERERRIFGTVNLRQTIHIDFNYPPLSEVILYDDCDAVESFEIGRVPEYKNSYLTKKEAIVTRGLSEVKIALYKDSEDPYILRIRERGSDKPSRTRGRNQTFFASNTFSHKELELRTKLGDKYLLFRPFLTHCNRTAAFQIHQGVSLKAISVHTSGPERVYLAYRCLKDVSQILKRFNREGLTHGRLDLSHILYERSGYALTGLSCTPTIGAPRQYEDDEGLYPSPEIFLNRGHRAKSDLWALGVCLWQLLVPQGDLQIFERSPDDLLGMMQKLLAFQNWRNRMIKGVAGFTNTKKIGTLGRAWNALMEVDQHLAHYILGHLLNPIESYRPSLDEIIEFSHSAISQIKDKGAIEAAINLKMQNDVGMMHYKDLLEFRRQRPDLNDAATTVDDSLNEPFSRCQISS